MKRLLAFLFLIQSSAAAQYSLEVRFVTAPERTTYIASFQYNSITYGSARDLAKAFKLGARMDVGRQQLEIKTERYTVRLIANNPFVVITDADYKPTVHQFWAMPVFATNDIFVPLESIAPLLDALLGVEIVFNKNLQLVAVGEIGVEPSFSLDRISTEERFNGTLIRIHLNKYIADYESWLKPIDADGKPSGQYWLYVTLAGATADTMALETFKPSGIIKEFLLFQSPTSVQLTFKLNGEIKGTELLQSEENNDLLLTIHTPTQEELALRRRQEIEKDLDRERSKWKLDVVVIDPGHGGRDPGAIGVTRQKEKDITLAVGLRLGKLIEKHLKDVKVVYTRTRDEFVELYRRGQLANEAGGKLFISIHCNSMPRKPNPANGFELYLLRPGKTEHAIQIAERENAVIQFEEGYQERYQELTEENFILVTMSQSANMKYSEQFADLLQKEMEIHSGLENQGVKQAGFHVLVGASMPNILAEIGYLSNRNDERFLKSQKGQQKISQAIFSAVKRYKQEYEKGLEEGKMVGTTN